MTFARVAGFMALALGVLWVAGYVVVSVGTFQAVRGFPDSRRAWIETFRTEARVSSCAGDHSPSLAHDLGGFEARLGACLRQARLEEARVLSPSDPSEVLVMVYACQADEFAARFLFTAYRSEGRTSCRYDLAGDVAHLPPAYDKTTAFMSHEDRTLLTRFLLAVTQD